MGTQKYSRSINLICPTCGGEQFEFEDAGGTIASAKCTNCGREFTKDRLIDENSENVNEHIKEMGQDITKDFAKEMRNTLRKALRNSKNMKFR